jgi:hypothetical protein
VQPRFQFVNPEHLALNSRSGFLYSRLWRPCGERIAGPVLQALPACGESGAGCKGGPPGAVVGDPKVPAADCHGVPATATAKRRSAPPHDHVSNRKGPGRRHRTKPPWPERGMSPYRLSTVESELRRHTPPTGQLPPSVWAAPDDSLVDDPMTTWSSARLAGSATTPSKTANAPNAASSARTHRPAAQAGKAQVSSAAALWSPCHV